MPSQAHQGRGALRGRYATRLEPVRNRRNSAITIPLLRRGLSGSERPLSWRLTPETTQKDGNKIMVAKLTTLPRTLLVAGALAMAPAFAFAQSAAPSVTTSVTAPSASTSTTATAPKETVKQDTTAKVPEAKSETKTAKPVAKTAAGEKKVHSAKTETKDAVKTPVKAETKSDAKVDAKTPTAPATPAAQPKS